MLPLSILFIVFILNTLAPSQITRVQIWGQSYTKNLKQRKIAHENNVVVQRFIVIFFENDSHEKRKHSPLIHKEATPDRRSLCNISRL